MSPPPQQLGHMSPCEPGSTGPWQPWAPRVSASGDAFLLGVEMNVGNTTSGDQGLFLPVLENHVGLRINPSLCSNALSLFLAPIAVFFSLKIYNFVQIFSRCS